ncbi:MULTISPECIES: hypothetical protein [Streptomyces]|uniref:Mce-associated membrane protein n=1 Tax=Streptomyces microflavus TaxID=1919 RepID=A0ABV1PYT5_STRMI|nr:hypothetical protein [Streptomyces sp. BE282]MEE1734090.1 hypothetical protein [Streptomyces sp. BE282]MEE1734759.1 hypothetical protein [Streptomyces sp. BE282]WTF72980.1 procyclic acidic repetitive family protein [Streptomyces microflavus]
MSTTRHLVNRRRRLATSPSRATAAPVAGEEVAEETTAPPGLPEPEAGHEAGHEPGHEAEREPDLVPEPEPGADAVTTSPSRRLRPRLPAVLGVLTVLLGAFAAWALASAASLRDEPARQNTALTDIGATSEVKGRISEAVGAVFSYDYASPARSDRAAKTYLTGRAVQQHKDMLAEVRAQAPKQKLVLTTTVTGSGVEYLDGDRARLLIFADQSNTRTGKDEETTYAAAMFAVDAVRDGDTWRIATIDTFTR